MSQRVSGYARKDADRYETPAWVAQVLVPHLPPRVHRIWEPACASGNMVCALLAAGFDVIGTDLTHGDFLERRDRAASDAIVTNPPYDQAAAFIEHALALVDVVAMLLRTDYDHAQTRQHLFGHCPYFAKKLVLTRRIVWFERPGAAPSFNHAWFIWDAAHRGPPTIAYDAPKKINIAKRNADAIATTCNDVAQKRASCFGNA